MNSIQRPIQLISGLFAVAEGSYAKDFRGLFMSIDQGVYTLTVLWEFRKEA